MALGEKDVELVGNDLVKVRKAAIRKGTDFDDAIKIAIKLLKFDDVKTIDSSDNNPYFYFSKE